jgi:hypothetical protein
MYNPKPIKYFLEVGKTVNINGTIYEPFSFNVEINNKRTNCSSPCIMCALDAFNDMELCETIECIQADQFLYLKTL